MAWKCILCAYSGDEARGSGLRHAIRVAKHHSAHLTGVLRHDMPVLQQRFGQHLPRDLVRELEKADRAHVEEIRQRFIKAVQEGGLAGVSEFVEIEPAMDGLLSEFAHAFDLVIMGTHTEIGSQAHLSPHPDLVALRSGRPVMVVPNEYDGHGLAKRALVAWDGARAATRALSDTMPVLAEKEHVRLVSVGTEPRGADRVLRNLERHGVKATLETVPRQGSVAETLIAEAAKSDAKLIVMGAFEHSKFSHDLFGGVTTELIAKTNVPVIMAH